MEGIKFTASLWKVSRDHDGEVTLIMRVPEAEAIKVIAIPTKVSFNVNITGGYNG